MTMTVEEMRGKLDAVAQGVNDIKVYFSFNAKIFLKY
jgi:hypothetical protein